MPKLPELLTVSEIAHKLKLHPHTIYNYLRLGIIPGHRLGTRKGWRVKREDLDKFINTDR